MTSSAILALDAGTTSSRALVFDSRGRVLALAQREFRQIYPQPGWVEHDAMEIWETQRACMAEAIGKAGVPIAAIGITNQRETTVLWDRDTGRPVANAIVWQDRRTAEFCESIREQEELVREKTGLKLDPYFSGTKIRWLLEHVGKRDNLAFGTIDSWLVWNLTGGKCHVTDVSNASRTMLFDIHRGEWSDELLALLDIPKHILPDVRSSSEVYAHTTDGIPIAGIAGDQQAALFGQQCTRAGMAKNTYGTGSFVVMNTGTEAVASKHGLLSTIAWQLPNEPVQYALEGSIFVTGAAVKWLRDGLGIIRDSREIEPLAASVADSGGVILVPAFAGLGAPHWDPFARGAIVGMTLGTTKAHIARATLESIALQAGDVLEAMQKDSGIALKELRVDGGATVNDLLMQMQADLAGIPVLRARTTETTALGAASLAARAVGAWNEIPWEADRTFEPRMSADEREARKTAWRDAVKRTRT
jgi:glycerol kinase